MPSVLDRLLLGTVLLSFDLLLGMEAFDGRGDEAGLEGDTGLGAVTVLVGDAGEVAEAGLRDDADWEGEASSGAAVELGTDVVFLAAEACLGDDTGLDGDAGREVGACLGAVARLEAEADFGDEVGAFLEVFLEAETNVGGVCAISGTAAAT